MLKPLPVTRWNFAAAAHLLNRAGFGGSPSEIERLVKAGPEAAVAQLVDYEKTSDPAADPAWAVPDPTRMERMREYRDMNRQVRNASETERAELEKKRREMQRMENRSQQEQMLELRHWWLQRMATGPRPLQEKLVLFWHGHFATSVQKVKDAYFMFRQNQVFRQHASGNWRGLLAAVTEDPAMLIWLDQAQSRRTHPNENYAREVMELFALGEGNYTEKDVLEAARAFTGLSLDRMQQKPVYRPALHDPGVKTVLGKTGNLDWKDVLNQIVAQPQAARFIVGKLWAYFASDDVPPSVIDPLSELFRFGGYEFKPVLQAMFRSEAFYEPKIMRTQVKGPVHWLVSTVRLLERPLPPAVASAALLRQLGQDLFAPPNVKGWDGGISWITTNNLINRYNYASWLVLGREGLPNLARGQQRERIQARLKRAGGSVSPVDPAKLFTADDRKGIAPLLAALGQRFLQAPLRPKQAEAMRSYLETEKEIDDRVLRNAVRLVMSTPEYQLT